MDGYALCREWKKRRYLKIYLLFFILPHTRTPKTKNLHLNLEPKVFIIKPQEPEDFMAIIETALTEIRKKNKKPKFSKSFKKTFLKNTNKTLIRKMKKRLL